MENSELTKLVEYYKENKLAHAYLISTNNINKCQNVLLKVIKNIFCNETYKDECNKCSLCHLIDIQSLPNLIIIEPENDIIKKEQILELKRKFSKSSQIINKKVYIIKHCEKMNKESANTMLKFLEEPYDDVIGFFVTNNFQNVISTIVSRCQLIDENFEGEKFDYLETNKEKYDFYYDLACQYICNLEKSNDSLILCNLKYFSDLDKLEVKTIFQIILDIYQNLINNKDEFLNNNPKLNYLSLVSFDNAVNKTKLLIEFLRKLTYNVNVEMLLDKFAIEVERLKNENI